MKVLLVVGSLHAGGLERYVSRVAILAIQSKQFIPIVLCLTSAQGIFYDKLNDHGVEVIEAPSGWQRNCLSLKILTKKIRKLDVDVVHSQVNFSIIQQWLAFSLAGVNKIIFTERNCYPLYGYWRLRRIAQFYVIKLFGVSYTANSLKVRDHLSRMVFFPKRQIAVIPNGVQISSTLSEDREMSRRTYGWSKYDKVIGYVARMDQHKGHFYFLDVMEKLLEISTHKVKICFVGNGDLMSKLKERVSLSNLRYSSTFTGVISEVEKLMPAFDILCLFSEREGMPNVVIEAMAAGVPVFANPVGNVPELFSTNAGYLNTSTDSDKTADLLNKLLDNLEGLIATGARGQKNVRDNYGLVRSFHILMEQYSKL